METLRLLTREGLALRLKNRRIEANLAFVLGQGLNSINLLLAFLRLTEAESMDKVGFGMALPYISIDLEYLLRWLRVKYASMLSSFFLCRIKRWPKRGQS
ncbi:hypothetical protein CRG98_035235 [Punica granatum]|uniref:Uncharacterized protein n=1 Tax=Punica granatum TaxID=22663 RepID=A0A2I0ILZ8_PUNGR|nr:hypothetical protein CRG98_035235 [Punica granatum]